MLDDILMKERKDIFLDQFIFTVGEISQGRAPEPCLFRETTYLLEQALKHFPSEQQEEIHAMIATATEQYLYVEALNKVKATKQGHEQRERQISEFLARYKEAP